MIDDSFTDDKTANFARNKLDDSAASCIQDNVARSASFPQCYSLIFVSVEMLHLGRLTASCHEWMTSHISKMNVILYNQIPLKWLQMSTHTHTHTHTHTWNTNIQQNHLYYTCMCIQMCCSICCIKGRWNTLCLKANEGTVILSSTLLSPRIYIS